MFIIAIPLPVCIIIGANRTLKDVEFNTDGSLFISQLLGVAYILIPFNYLYSHFKNSAIEEKNSKLDTQDLLKIIVNNLKESIMICSNKQIEYVNDLFVNNFELQIEEY